METRFHLFVCGLLEILACESIVLCMCSGNSIIGYHTIMPRPRRTKPKEFEGPRAWPVNKQEAETESGGVNALYS